ncbi:carbohydrate kinase [Kineococcus sp. T13]|uniref:FGGY family carbohydrate kinase n=1 Tax=Kineococcus vitellinus TaxID=2696565 RepID=UPI001411F556|nr:carbohydrate kinase [Kineococcus vitellinus]
MEPAEAHLPGERPRAAAPPAPASGAVPVVLGVDLGTTSTKVVAFDAAGSARAAAGAGYALREGGHGHVELDALEVVEAATRATADAAARARAAGCAVVAVSFSSAMHSLIGVDAAGEPVTGLITWADTRSTDLAERLRPTALGRRLHARTGTPVHPMSPLVKLAHLRAHEPELFARTARWVQVKDLLLHRWTGEWVVDRSTASGTGLFSLTALDWDPEALELAGVGPAQLPLPVGVEHARLRLSAAGAAATGLGRGTVVVAGGGDGPMANLGVGAVHPGVAALSIGTSGALRVAVDRPGTDPDGRTFCYALTDGLWTVGGAVTNGGVVLRWLTETLAPDLASLAAELGDVPEEPLLDLAASVPPGSEGLLMLPHLLSERAPQWSAVSRGSWVGLQRRHTRAHLVRAAVEGVCQQLALVADSVTAAGHAVEEVRATGGFARSAVWRQLLADVLGRPVSYMAGGQEGSSYGAALLGQHALGMVGDLTGGGAAVVGEVLEPDPAAAAVYARLRPVHAALADALAPTFRALRELAADPAPHPAADPAADPAALGTAAGRGGRAH